MLTASAGIFAARKNVVGGGGPDWLTYTNNLVFRARGVGQSYTNGQNVPSFVASVGNNAVQATSSKQPVFTAASADFGGKPTIVFDGVDDSMEVALSITGAVTVMLIGRLVTGSADRIIGLSNGTGNDYNGGNVLAFYNTISAYDGDAGGGRSGISWSGNTDPFAAISCWDGTNVQNIINSTVGSEDLSAWDGPMTTILISQVNGGSGGHTALELAELIVWNEAVPSGNRTEIIAAAGTEYGITI